MYSKAAVSEVANATHHCGTMIDRSIDFLDVGNFCRPVHDGCCTWCSNQWSFSDCNVGPVNPKNKYLFFFIKNAFIWLKDPKKNEFNFEISCTGCAIPGSFASHIWTECVTGKQYSRLNTTPMQEENKYQTNLMGHQDMDWTNMFLCLAEQKHVCLVNQRTQRATNAHDAVCMS